MLTFIVGLALAAEMVLVLHTSFNLAYSALQSVMLHAVYASSFFIAQAALLKHFACSIGQQVITALTSHAPVVVKGLAVFDEATGPAQSKGRLTHLALVIAIDFFAP